MFKPLESSQTKRLQITPKDAIFDASNLHLMRTQQLKLENDPEPTPPIITDRFSQLHTPLSKVRIAAPAPFVVGLSMNHLKIASPEVQEQPIV